MLRTISLGFCHLLIWATENVKTSFYVHKRLVFLQISLNPTDFSDFTNIMFSLLMKTDSIFSEEKQLELSRGPRKSKIKPDGPGTTETSRRDAPAQAWVWFSEINLSVFWQTAAGMGFLRLNFTPCCFCQNGVIVWISVFFKILVMIKVCAWDRDCFRRVWWI